MRFKGLTPDQLQRVEKMRADLDKLAKPLGDLELLRQAFAELLTILLEEHDGQHKDHA